MLKRKWMTVAIVGALMLTGVSGVAVADDEEIAEITEEAVVAGAPADAPATISEAPEGDSTIAAGKPAAGETLEEAGGSKAADLPFKDFSN